MATIPVCHAGKDFRVLDLSISLAITEERHRHLDADGGAVLRTAAVNVRPRPQLLQLMRWSTDWFVSVWVDLPLSFVLGNVYTVCGNSDLAPAGAAAGLVYYTWW